MTKKKFESKIDNSGLYKNLLEQEEFQRFGDFSRQFKICHRTLDGIGINYSRRDIKSLKGYIKILDSQPHFSDQFLDWLGPASQALLNLCHTAPSSLTCRKDGLAGINIALKQNLDTKEYTKSFYVKTSANKVKAVNMGSDGSFSKYEYRYISNKLFIFFIKRLLFLHLPRYYDCIELSLRKNGANATIYPQFNNPKLRDKNGCKKHFSKLKNFDEWDIEYDIFNFVESFERELSPITRGYTSFDLQRKIYFGLFSKRLSCFDL